MTQAEALEQKMRLLVEVNKHSTNIDELLENYRKASKLLALD